MKSRTIALALFAAALAACFPAISVAQTMVATMAAIKGPSGIALVRLFEDPPRTDTMRFTMTAAASADLVVAKLVSGEYDAAVLPVNIAAKLYNSGLPIHLAAITGKGMARFLTLDTSIHALADLRGREIFVAGQGATPDLVFRTIVASQGLKPGKDLAFSYSLAYPEAALALAAGRIQSAVLPEPFATMAMDANPAIKTPLDLDTLWKRATGQSSYPMTALVIRTKLAADPKAVAALLAAVEASIRWVSANPAAAGVLVARHELGLSTSVATRSIPRSNFDFERAPGARVAVEALLNAFLAIAPESVGRRLPGTAFYFDLP